MTAVPDSGESEEGSGEQASTPAPPSHYRSPRRRRLAKWAAVGLVVALVVGAFIYLSPSFFGALQGPGITFSFPTSSTSRPATTTKTTTSTGPTPNSVAVKSAIFHNDALSIDVVNTGTVWTKSLTVADICTPGFKSCYSYKAVSGHSLTETFALAPKAEYVYSISGVCVVPVASCTEFHPVVNFSYYYKVSFGYANGKSTTLRVTAKAGNTFPPSAAVKGLAYRLDTFPKTGSGQLTVNILTSPSLESANFTVSMFTRLGTDGFAQRLLYKATGCGGVWPAGCSSGNLTVIETFSTVRTGIGTPIYPLPYMLAVRDLTVSGTVYFAVWVPALNG